MPKLKKAFAGAAALAVAGIGLTALTSSSDAATPGECPVSGVVSAEAPIFTDREGMANDTVTIPQSDCINYTINGWDTPAGTYSLSNLTPYEKTDSSNDWLVATATVQAEAKADHWQLSGTYWWQQGFIGVYDPKNEVVQAMIGLPAYAIAPIQPTAPTFTDAHGLNEATVTIPQHDGVTYTIKGDKKTEVVTAGTYKVVDFATIKGTKATVTVTATSSDKKHVILSGTTTWTQEVYAALTSGTTSPTADPTSQSITDGIYVITSTMNNNKALDVNQASKKAGANIQLWDRNNGNAQRFQVTHLGGNQYSIVNVHSGKALDIDGNSTKAGANVHQWTWSGSNNQRFIIAPAKNGGYTIQAVSSGLFLDVYGSRTANGTNVIQWSDNGGSANQRWNFNAYTASPALKEVTAVEVRPDTHCHIIIPKVEGVDYYYGDQKVAPGTDLTTLNTGAKPVTVKAQAGYKLTNPNARWEAFYCVGEPAIVTPTPTPSTVQKVPFVAPTFDQKNNTYTIPDVEGLQYSVAGKNVAPGTYAVTGNGNTVDSNGRVSVSITAKPKAGYVSDSGYAAYTWTATFAVRTVTPVAPTYKAGWSFWFINVESEYTIPSVTGIDYYVNGSKVAAGTYTIPRGTSVGIEAKPQQGYSFPLNTVVINRWTFSSY